MLNAQERMRHFKSHEHSAKEDAIRGAPLRAAGRGPGRCAVGHRPLPGLPALPAASRWVLVRGTRSRLDARGRLHLSAHAAGKRRSGPAQRALHRDDALPERGRQLEHLSRRSGQHLALGQVLLLGQADGRRRGRSAPGQVPRVGSGAWRRGRVQHLHQDVSLRAGRVRLRRGARHSAGDCSLSQMVLLQHLRDFFLVAVDSCSAGHHVRQKALQEDSLRAGNRRAIVGGRANSILRLRMDRKSIFSWRNFFIVLDRLMHWAEAVHIARAQAGPQARGKVDAGAAGDDRRAGRHLSGHAERHHRAALPGLLRGRSAGDPRARRV
jgi:hypothetical protein